MTHRQATTSNAEGGSRPVRTWLRRIAVVVLIGGLLITLGLWFISRSEFIIARVAPEIGRKLGGDVTVEHAKYHGGGLFVFEDVRLRAPTIDGLAGEVAHIDEARVRIDMGALVGGTVQLNTVDLFGAIVRISEREDDPNQFNLAELRPDFSAATKDVAPPIMSVHDVRFVFGEHDDNAHFIQRHARRMKGTFAPRKGTDHTYNFALHDIVGEDVDESQAIGVSGTWNMVGQSFDMIIDNMRFDDRAYQACPQQVRMWWDRMDLEGTVSAKIEWSRETPLYVELELIDAGVTVPFDTGEFWGRFEDGRSSPSFGLPRMRVETGRIVVTPDRLRLDELHGVIIGSEDDPSLVGIPYAISGELRGFPAVDQVGRDTWATNAIAKSPFEMEVRTEQFRVGDTSATSGGVELPRRVTEALERFNLRQWSLSTSFRVWRDEPIDGEAAPVRTTGTAFISDAEGMFDQFRYPLTELTAYLEWDENQLTIHEANGRGQGACVISVTGRITPLGRDPDVLISVRATDLPVDDQLRMALSDGRRRLLESLVNRPAAQSLEAHGVWPEGDGPAPDEPWDIAGVIDLDLLMHREEGPHQPLVLTGTARLPWFGMLYDQFPYPFWLRDGVVQFFDDRIVLGSPEHGIEVITPNGGIGRLRGKVITRIDGQGVSQPDLEFDIGGDRTSTLLTAAIPLTSAERERAVAEGLSWPGEAGSSSGVFFERLGLDAGLDYHGTINVNNVTGRGQYDIVIELDDGTITPGPSDLRGVSSLPLNWPDSMSLTDVSGRFLVTRDHVRIEGLRGRQGDGMLVCAADVGLRPDDSSTNVHVTLNAMRIEEAIEEIADSDAEAEINRVFDTFQPTGVYDAEYDITIEGDHVDAVFRAEPTHVTVHVDSGVLNLRHAGGFVAYDDGGLRLEDLEFEVEDPSAATPTMDERFSLAGAHRNVDDGSLLELRGEWRGARVESPLLIGVMKLAGRDALLEWYDSAKPAGVMNASFDVRTMTGRPTQYVIGVEPLTLDATIRGARMSAAFDEPSRIVLTPTAIDLAHLVGRSESGDFDVTGVINHGDVTTGSLAFDFTGALRTDVVRAILPTRANEVLDAMKFNDVGRSELLDSRLDFAIRQGKEGPYFDDTTLVTTLLLHSASFDAGVEFTEVEGRFDLRVEHTAEASPYVEVTASAEYLRALGQQLTHAVGTIRLRSGSDRMMLERLKADMHRGVLWVEGHAMLADEGAYQFRVETVGASMEGIFKDTQRSKPSEKSDEGRVPSGAVYADVTIGGTRGDPAGRRGRGIVRIVGGRVASIPIALQLSQLLQFTIPSDGNLDYAGVDFFIDGDTMLMERILLESSSGNNALLQIFGTGELNLETFDLRAWLQARSGIAVIREIVGEISDSFFRIEVTGTLDKPVPRLIPAGSAPQIKHLVEPRVVE